MEPIVQQPYNMFAPPKVTKPVEVYDPNQGWRGKPAVENIIAAQNTPQERLKRAEMENSGGVINEGPGYVNRGTGKLGDPNSSTAGMDYLNSLYTSPQEEERLRKASLMNQRILAIGDAIRHIGNIANTVNYAPYQQFNNPVQEEQARYEKGKAMRDRANQQYYTYQQAKAAQDQRAKQMEADRKQKADQWNATFKFNAAKAAAEQAERQRQFNEKLRADTEHRDRTAAEKERSNRANEKLRGQSNSIAAGNLALSREKFNYLKSKGTGGGRGESSYDFATPNGNITMPKNFNQTQKDQVIAKFDKYINKSEIQRQMESLGLNTQDPAQVRNFQFAKMLQEHQDVADYVSEKFGGKQTFTSNPLARPETSAPQPMFQTPWGGAAFGGENPYDQYLLSDEGQGVIDDDYEQYLIK